MSSVRLPEILQSFKIIVDTGEGDGTEIIVNRGDNAKELATRFSRKHGLQPEL